MKFATILLLLVPLYALAGNIFDELPPVMESSNKALGSRTLKQTTRTEILTRERTRVMSGFKRQTSAAPYPTCPNSEPAGSGRTMYANLINYVMTNQPGNYLGSAASTDYIACATTCSNTAGCTIPLFYGGQCALYSGPATDQNYRTLGQDINTMFQNQDCATVLSGSSVANIPCCQLYV